MSIDVKNYRIIFMLIYFLTLVSSFGVGYLLYMIIAVDVINIADL